VAVEEGRGACPSPRRERRTVLRTVPPPSAIAVFSSCGEMCEIYRENDARGFRQKTTWTQMVTRVHPRESARVHPRESSVSDHDNDSPSKIRFSWELMVQIKQKIIINGVETHITNFWGFSC